MEKPACDICGQPYHRHNRNTGVAMCPIIPSYRTRPTADLGEDGELVERLRRYVSIADGKALASVPPSALRQAADRLILYREALVKARSLFVYPYDDQEAIAEIDAVLSRSGG